MSDAPKSSSPVSDELVERAWSAIVGSDIAVQCHQASIVRGDLRTALEAAFGVAQRSLDRDAVAAIINDRTMINDEGFVQNSEAVADAILALSSTDRGGK